MTVEATGARDGPPRRPRMAGGVTRSRLLALLRERARPCSAAELAPLVGLHPNTVRPQLDRLADEGLAIRAPAVARGRGRPAVRYRAAPRTDEPGSFRDLAAVLADELARLPDAQDRALAAGERWGRASARPVGAPGPAGATPPPLAAPDALGALAAVLEHGGFAPDPVVEGEPIRLRRCPFGPLARERPGVVCAIHLGLMRGTLAELDAPIDAVGLDPFVEPDLCVAHLAARAARDRSAGAGRRVRRGGVTR